MRINFADVEQPKTPEPVPAGKYDVVCTGAEAGEVKNGPNKGKPMYKFEFTIQAPGEEGIDDRKVWDNMSLIPPHTDSNGKERKGTYWRLQQLLQAVGLPADDDLDLDDLDGDDTTLEDYMMGQSLRLDVSQIAARTDPESGKEYAAQNRVKAFLPGDDDANVLP